MLLKCCSQSAGSGEQGGGARSVCDLESQTEMSGFRVIPHQGQELGHVGWGWGICANWPLEQDFVFTWFIKMDSIR